MEDSLEKWLSIRGEISVPRQFPSGTEIGGWRISAFLARGGAGEVYRAENIKDGSPAAIKVLYKADADAKVRFLREIEFLLENKHPSFPRLYERGEYEGRPYFVMEILEPLDLPSDDAGVARLILFLCIGVEFLHSQGLVHRDIKPDNIMLREGFPVLIDLGLLKRMTTDFSRPRNTVSVIDGHVVGVGTPGYAAPEQFEGKLVSPSSDLHALGILANACFHEQPPLGWRGIIRRSTSSLSSQRYPSVSDFARAIRHRHYVRHAMIAAGILVLCAFSQSIYFAVRYGQRAERLRHLPDSGRATVPLAPEGSSPEDDIVIPDGARLTDRSSPHVISGVAVSPSMGEVTGLTGLVWRTSGRYPWLVETNVSFQGHATLKNTGNGGGEAVSWLSTEITGPVELEFHYRKNFYGSRFQIVSDDTLLFVDAEASHGDETWYERKIAIPARRHAVFFIYTHAGIGWAHEFNGVYLGGMTLKKIDRALDPLKDLPHDEHYHLVPNVNFDEKRSLQVIHSPKPGTSSD